MAWIGAVVQGITGGIQMGVSMDQLSKLPGAKEYSAGADLETATGIARRAAQQGMTPAERAVAEQRIGTAQSRTQRAMEQRGLGNLAAAVSQIRTTEAMNALSAQNAQIKRQSLGQYAQLAGQMQAIENQNIQSFNKMLAAQQTALGQSAAAGFKNLAGTGATIAEAIEGDSAENIITVDVENEVRLPEPGQPEDSPLPEEKEPGPMDPPKDNLAASQPSDNLLDANQLGYTGFNSVGEDQFNTTGSSMNFLDNSLYDFTSSSNQYNV